MIRTIFDSFMGYTNYVLFIKKVIGEENILPYGFVAAANHTSYLDIWAMSIVFYVKKRRYLHFMALKSLVKDGYTTLIRKLFEGPQSYPIFIDTKKPGKEMFDSSVNVLKKGHIIGIYPEGIRSKDGKLQRGKTGAVRIAIWSKVPIVPIGIKGAFELMPFGKKIPKLRKQIEMNIGKPIYFKEYYNKKLTKEILRKLTNQVMTEIARLSNQKYDEKNNTSS